MNDGDRDSRYSNEPEGRFANQFKIGYRQGVFILEFYQSFNKDEKAHLHTRIITIPEDLKFFLGLLQNSMEKYEKTWRPIIDEERD